MNRDEQLSLLAEQSTLQRILADIPEEDVLDRGSFQARLEDVESRLAAVSANLWEPARARLTFRGRPVVGGYGVFADFGVEATGSFIKAVTAMAASLARPLGQFGPLPNRIQNQLLITGTAVGSFGFQLEEYQVGQLRLEESPVAAALAQTQQLLHSALGSDEELADAVELTQPRVRDTVRDFLRTLVENEATCTVEYRDTIVTFADVQDVRRSLARLAQDYLHESEHALVGGFQGFLPQRRTFEFKQVDTDEVLTGRVSLGIANPEVINKHLGVPAQITLSTIRVGQGRPRYVLNQLPEWMGTDAADE